jgi:hypothetical protein
LVKAIIKEKEAARKEFEEGVQKGYTMAYSEQMDETPDLMKVKLGNLLPSTKLILKFEYI